MLLRRRTSDQCAVERPPSNRLSPASRPVLLYWKEFGAVDDDLKAASVAAEHMEMQVEEEVHFTPATIGSELSVIEHDIQEAEVITEQLM